MESAIGKIQRKVLWSHQGEKAWRPDLSLGPAILEKMTALAAFQQNPVEWLVIRELAADDFFYFCEIAYDANDYFTQSPGSLTRLEKYWQMADGRHGGLMDIKQDSPGEFTYWHRSQAALQGYPWEICRRNESGPISLSVSSHPNGWLLHLAGSVPERVEEIVKMAVALFVKGIPFILDEAVSINNLLRGEDYLGVVPEEVDLRYAFTLFPENDRIVQYIHLDSDLSSSLGDKIIWLPEGAEPGLF